MAKRVVTSWIGAPDADNFVKKLIPKHFINLKEASIHCLKKDKPIRKGGKLCIATIERCSSKIKFLTGHDYIVSINEDLWNELDNREKEAVIHHELSHCRVVEDDDGEITYNLVSHDIEEFISTVENFAPNNPNFEAIKALIEKLKKLKAKKGSEKAEK